MWVQPTVINGSSLGRTKWKTMQQSLHFLLQQGPSELSGDGVSYRIVTRSFPTYIIACSEALPPSLDHFRFLHEEFLEQMPVKKPKELVKNIKAYYLNFPDYQAPPTGDANVEEAVTAKLNERIEKALSRHFAPSELMSFAEVSEGSEEEAPPSRSLSPETTGSVHKHSRRAKRELREPESNHVEEPGDLMHGTSARQMLNAEASYDLYVDLAPGVRYERKQLSFPGLERLTSVFDTFFGLPDGVKEIYCDSGFRDVFRRLFNLLTYPSIYLDDGFAYKTSFQFLSEVQAVSVRRKVLLAVTLYTAFMRYCSADLFYVLLIVANFIALFLMKDTFKVNKLVSKGFNVSRDDLATAETFSKGTSKHSSTLEIVNGGLSSVQEVSNQVEASVALGNNDANPSDVHHHSNAPSHQPTSTDVLAPQNSQHLASFVSLPPNPTPYKDEVRRANSSERLRSTAHHPYSTHGRPSLPNLRKHPIWANESADRPFSIVFPSNGYFNPS